MDVLLSIKPKYSNSIYTREKKYEFRRSIFDSKKVKRVYIYTTSPEMKVTGLFTIKHVHEDAPEKLWEKFHEHSGIDRNDFFSYFDGCRVGYAIEIDEVKKFDEPIDPKEKIADFVAPQSFLYLKSGTFSKRHSLMEWDRTEKK